MKPLSWEEWHEGRYACPPGCHKSDEEKLCDHKTCHLADYKAYLRGLGVPK